MSTGPTTYASWVEILNRFEKGDDTIHEEMNAGSFELDGGTAQRFYLHVNEAYKARKQRWLDAFQRSFQLQRLRSVDEFGIALRTGKQNLLPLARFVGSKGLPSDLRATLQTDLKEFVDEIKKSIKDNISKENNQRELLISVLSGFGVPEDMPPGTYQNSQKSSSEYTLPHSGKRNIIF